MVKVNVAHSKISIKTCYEDCTIADLDKLATYEYQQRGLIECFTDLPYTDFEKLLPEYQQAILVLLEWVNDNEYVNLPDPEKNISVGDESFGKIEMAKQVIGEGKPHYYILPNLCHIYLSDEWVSKSDVLKVFAQGVQIFESITVFLERHKDLGESEPDTEDQIEAGIEALRSFGSFGLMYSLTEGKPWMYDTLLSCTAESVYMTLRYSKAKSMYEENLVKIDKRKNANVSKNS